MKITPALFLIILFSTCKDKEHGTLQEIHKTTARMAYISKMRDSLADDNFKNGKPVSDLKRMYDSLDHIYNSLNHKRDSLWSLLNKK